MVPVGHPRPRKAPHPLRADNRRKRVAQTFRGPRRSGASAAGGPAAQRQTRSRPRKAATQREQHAPTVTRPGSEARRRMAAPPPPAGPAAQRPTKRATARPSASSRHQGHKARRRGPHPSRRLRSRRARPHSINRSSHRKGPGREQREPKPQGQEKGPQGKGGAAHEPKQGQDKGEQQGGERTNETTGARRSTRCGRSIRHIRSKS